MQKVVEMNKMSGSSGVIEETVESVPKLRFGISLEKLTSISRNRRLYTR